MIDKIFSMLDDPFTFLMVILGLSAGIVLAAEIKSVGLEATLEMLLRFVVVFFQAVIACLS